jgi:glycerol-3-phosphate acyltransferase PlsX
LEDCGINYIGNVEAKDVFAGAADVVVTDGFTGNVFLKSSEAVGKMLFDIIKENVNSTPYYKLGGLMITPALKPVKKMMDPAEIGAAPLLGIDGLVFVGHGRSDARAMTSALKTAHESVQADLLGSLRNGIQERLVNLPSSESAS